MHTLYTIDADLKRIGARQTIYAKQGDTCSRKIKISLYSDGNPWTIPTGATAAIRFQKGDGHGGIYDKLGDGTTAYEIGGTRGDITITLAPEALTCPGNVLVDVALISGADVIGVFNIVIYVEAAPTAGITPSNNYYNYQTLADINQAINEAKAAATGAVKSVNGVKPDAGGNVTVQIPSSGVTAVNGRQGSVHLAVNALAECQTPPTTAIKQIKAFDGFTLISGATLGVKFLYSNAAENPRLSYAGQEMSILDRLTGKPIDPGDITAGVYHFQVSPTGWLLLDKQQSSGTATPVPGDPGEDGGYWTPNVTDDGALTWTPSKDGMGEAPAAANIKGPQGGDGQDGAPGQDGKDGISPTVSVAAIDNGHRITITDVSGAKTIDVLDGQPGDDGVTPNLQIGTVTTLPAGSQATAKITGTAANPVLSLGIPRGADATGVSSINSLTGAVSLPISGSCVCNSDASDRLKVLTSVSAGFDPSADGAILAAQFKNPGNTATNPELQIGQTTYTILHPNNLTPPAASALKKSVHHFSMRGSTRAAILLDPYVAPSTVNVDATLTQSGKAADAKATGDMIKQVRDKLTSGKEALAGTSLTLQDPEDGDRGVRFDVDPKISDETGAPIAQRLSIYGIYGDEPVRLGNIYDPAGPQDAATKGYVDAAIDTISAGSGTGGGGVDVLVDDTLQEAAAYTFQGPGAADTYRRIIIDIACTAQEANVNTASATIFGSTIATYYINAATENNRKTTIDLEIINSNTAIFRKSSLNTSSADPMNATTYINVGDQLIVTASINAEKPLLRIPAELPTGTRIRIMGVKA